MLHSGMQKQDGMDPEAKAKELDGEAFGGQAAWRNSAQGGAMASVEVAN